MRKRRVSNLATDSMVAATSTAMTLWHRLPMFGFASLATASERQAEATRMVDEKAAAFIEGCIAANMEAVRAVSAAAMRTVRIARQRAVLDCECWPPAGLPNRQRECSKAEQACRARLILKAG